MDCNTLYEQLLTEMKAEGFNVEAAEIQKRKPTMGMTGNTSKDATLTARWADVFEKPDFKERADEYWQAIWDFTPDTNAPELTFARISTDKSVFSVLLDTDVALTACVRQRRGLVGVSPYADEEAAAKIKAIRERLITANAAV